MSVTERLMGTGRWSLTFKPDTPREILAAINLKKYGFGHIVITPTHLDLDAVTDDDTKLNAARYIGVLRDRSSLLEIGGPGLAMWLGDEDGKGAILEQDNYGTSLTNWRTLLTPPGWTGTSSGGTGGSFTRDVVRETAIEVLPDVCSFFNVEWKIGYTSGWKFSMGDTASLFNVDPVAIILRDIDAQLRDPDVIGLGGGYQIEQDLEDWSLDVRYYTGDEAAPALTVASQAGLQPKDVRYRRVDGVAITMSRAIEAFNLASSGTGLAQAQFARFKEPHESITATSIDYDITNDVRAGDYVWIWDPDRGLVGASGTEVYYRGHYYRPIKIRVHGHTWPIRSGMGVYFRRYADNDTTTWPVDWVDLTDWIEWEDGTAETVELGDLPRKATGRIRTRRVQEVTRYTAPAVTD